MMGLAALHPSYAGWSCHAGSLGQVLRCYNARPDPEFVCYNARRDPEFVRSISYFHALVVLPFENFLTRSSA
jgi:hypothetical protein